MNKIWYCLFLIVFGISTASSQSISKSWQFQPNTEDSLQNPLTAFSSENVLNLSEGRFSITRQASQDTLATGEYIYQNNNLVFFYSTPKDTIRNFRVSGLSEGEMGLTEGSNVYAFQEYSETIKEAVPAEIAKEMVPSEGISFTSVARGALGMLVLLLIAFLFSSNRKAINWRTILIGLGAQLLLAIGVLKITFIQKIFEFVGSIFVLILDFTAAGSEFLLGGMMDVESFGFIFLFQVLPTIIFFSALTSVLFYLGIIQIVVRGMAWVLTKLMGISGAESLNVAGNIFLGQTEAPLMIKAYLEKMTRSEILLVMIGGMATVAGGVLAAYIGFLGGDDPALRLQFAKHLLAASVMAAPGAIVVSKILYPQQEPIDSSVDVSSEKIGSNILDAIANGTTEGLKLAANVAAMLLVFIAFIAMINYVLGRVGGWTHINMLMAEYTPYSKFSIESVLGLIFAPLMWIIGVAKEDMMLMGQLLGIKLAASEFVGYVQLADLKNPANALSLTYEKSVIMATYMLCGFANFASIGIQIGGIGSLAPGQRKTLSEFGMKALIGGTLASLLSATIAGMILG
ncbi:nucleoside transporter C-terminal domain-containing protein [Zunongwangia sp. F363]|uniref:Nucleoside transporter C-terminal domain-containing protein n=1 Tax=Autumnicola tepida TaxID=3075595 RepID=A0ABU3C5Z9_9FLAO|nr:nucleoside transporter C-terminal domain-containing protein [Zunongwangia sp. F363]MDT0641485.1 nucleoside transporter C-terminal domain-containing protein [Zunongwangia sp. F363]